MEYIALDVEGILTGTIVIDMTLSEQTIWFRLLGLAAKGHGRLGFIERAEGIGFTKEALYVELRCYSDEDKAVVDSALNICITGNDPRIRQLDNGVLEIVKWDKYQMIPKGTLKTTILQCRSIAERNNRTIKTDTPTDKQRRKINKAINLVNEAWAIETKFIDGTHEQAEANIKTALKICEVAARNQWNDLWFNAKKRHELAKLYKQDGVK